MKKILLSLISFSLLFSCSNVSSSIEEEITARIIACSDYQDPKGNMESEDNVCKIIDTMKENGINDIDNFFCCGDYDYEFTEIAEGIDSLKETILYKYDYCIDENDMILVQGNHDNINQCADKVNLTGSYDKEKYGIYVIDEDDYMQYNTDEEIIKNTSSKLNEYLEEKINNNYSKPIFILTHLPLNYNMRTYNDGDGKYARYLFDVINNAGNKGLNIIYLFGHDHSNGWDDYLGGSSIFLTHNDSILIADNSITEFSEHKLNFTYMNAGYVGYYRGVNAGSDRTLTMTSFDIYKNKVVINRYSEDGIHLLKSKGVRNEYKEEIGYEPNLKEYNSPFTISI